MQTQYNVLNYRILLYFHEYKFEIDIDKKIVTEILTTNKKTKNNRTITWLKFIRIDPDKENFDIFRVINEIFRNIKQLTKNTLMNKILKLLLRLEFK